MERALRSRLAIESIERVEHLFRLKQDERGAAIAERLLAFERARVAEGSIAPVGLGIVAR